MGEHGGATVRFTLLMPWGRVGSHLVTSALNAEHGIRVLNEPTTAIRTHGHRAKKKVAEISAEQFAHLETFTSELPAGLGAAGLKLSHRSLVEQEAYLGRLRALGYRLVLQTRENHLKCAVSQMRALERARAASGAKPAWASPWAVRPDEPKPGATALDPEEAVRLTRLFRTLHTRMLDVAGEVYGEDLMVVEYDRLSRAPEATIGAVFAYLGLDAPERIALEHRKATSDSLREDVLNYAEFAAAIEAAGLGVYL
ncbi:MAG: hypothetical protein RIG84_13680 [Roseovarius sp.]